MLMDVAPPVAGRGETRISPAELARARYEPTGVFAEGRRAELDLLREMGARDPSLGRLYEGHFNGAHLVALYGTDEQRARARDDVAAGRLFGVWNTQASEPLTIAAAGDRYVLGGAKTWASGADRVDRALVTARDECGATRMCLVPMDRARPDVDASAWDPLGMEPSNSVRVCFDGVALGDDDLIGNPDTYTRDPWFFGGALRFVAVHVGIVERLAGETFTYLTQRGRGDDALQIARAGEMRIATRAARNWIAAGEAAWTAYDALPTAANAANVVDTVDMARLGVERCALDVLERAIRSVGASGLLEPLPFAALVRDLTMYLRQPSPDAILTRIGTVAFAAR